MATTAQARKRHTKTTQHSAKKARTPMFSSRTSRCTTQKPNTAPVMVAERRQKLSQLSPHFSQLWLSLFAAHIRVNATKARLAKINTTSPYTAQIIKDMIMTFKMNHRESKTSDDSTDNLPTDLRRSDGIILTPELPCERLFDFCAHKSEAVLLPDITVVVVMMIGIATRNRCSEFVSPVKRRQLMIDDVEQLDQLATIPMASLGQSAVQ